MPKPVIPIVSPSSTVRQAAAKARLVGVEPPLLIVAASRGAADEFALALAADRGATFGVTRMGLTELVAKLAVPALAKRGLTPSAPLSDEAVAARVADDLLARDQLEYFTPVGMMPGFPRALNAAREWRRISGRSAPAAADDRERAVLDFSGRGEATCATVYGEFYDRLRVNIRGLHPALDRWMITEGYDKVLGRPLLDLARRELCIVAACAIARQDRQLHSHLHGALNAGAAAGVVTAALQVVAPLIGDDDLRRYLGLWARVQGK